jgi:FKBP-type peptidyl-prolyl cis-trans isomerase FklB
MTKRTLPLTISLLALSVGCATMQPTLSKETVLTTDMQKSSYAQGVLYMKNLQQSEIPLDPDLFMLGISDVLDKTPLRLNPEQLVRGRDWVYVQQMLYTERTSQKNEAEGDAFLKTNKNKAGVVTLASGVQYKILIEGKSKQKPTLKDTVTMRYRITRLNGELFSSTENTPKVPDVAVNTIMQGWQEPLLLMTVGSKWELYVPGSLAYGEAGAPEGKLGANETMIFNVELIGIKPPSLAKATTKALTAGSDGDIKPSSRW